MGVPLRVLRPRWLAEGEEREHMGIELDCPRHPDEHRVQLWFENPGDGDAPKPGATAFLLSCCDFEELTLAPSAGAAYRPLHIGHWHGWVVDGELSECRVTGVAW